MEKEGVEAMMDLRSRGKALHAKGDSNKRALMGKEILSSPSYQQFIQKRVKEDEERRRIQKDSQPPPRLRASPQRKETHTQQKQAQNAKIKPLMQNPVLAPNQDVTQGAVSVHDESTTTIVRERYGS